MVTLPLLGDSDNVRK